MDERTAHERPTVRAGASPLSGPLPDLLSASLSDPLPDLLSASLPGPPSGPLSERNREPEGGMR